MNAIRAVAAAANAIIPRPVGVAAHSANAFIASLTPITIASIDFLSVPNILTFFLLASETPVAAAISSA